MVTHTDSIFFSGKSTWLLCRLSSSLSTCILSISGVSHRLWCSYPSNALAPAYSYFAASYWPELPVLGSCHGTESAALFGCALLSSYLLLFIKFYIDTYKKPARGKKPVSNGHANGNGLVHFDVWFWSMANWTQVQERLIILIEKMCAHVLQGYIFFYRYLTYHHS